MLKKKTKAGGITMPDFKLYKKSCDHQDSMVLAQKQTYRPMGQNTEPRNGPSALWATNFDKAGKNIQWKKDSLFNKWGSENWTATCKRMKLDHSLTSYTKITSKWMKHLDVRQESIKILEENIRCNVFDIGHSNFFHDTSPNIRETKEKMNLLDFIKI